MDISTIPKTFWHALSLSVLITTGGLVFIAYQSSTVSIEIASAKIQLSSAITETKDIKSDLAAENEKLRRAAEELKTKVQLLEELVSSGPTPSITAETIRKLKPSDVDILERPASSISPERFKEFDSRIEQAQQYLK